LKNSFLPQFDSVSDSVGFHCVHGFDPVRALVRQSDERAERLQQAGSEIAVGSLEDFRDVTRAMENIDRAYFCPPLEPGTLRRATLFAAAAREAKLEVVVQLSQWVADAIHPAAHAREK
jgi:NAD(P)H dehydrogenase (quinone)